MNRCDRFRTKNGASPLREIGNPLIVDLCIHPVITTYLTINGVQVLSRHMADEKGRIQVSLYPVSVYDAPSVTKPFLSVLAR